MADDTIIDETTTVARGSSNPVESINSIRDIAKQYTDVGNGARFYLKNRRSVRYCRPIGWLIFDGTRWVVDHTDGIYAYAEKTALAVYGEAEDRPIEQREIAHHARSSQSMPRIRAMLDAARHRLAVSADDLDSDQMALNCHNGTIDLRTGTLIKHNRSHLITKSCNASYDPAAEAPIFTQFINRIFRGSPNLIPYVQRALGYAATGIVSEQSLFFLHGSGANGKTTLLDAVCYALGDYAGKADPELLMAKSYQSHPTGMADLKGKRLCVLSETNRERGFDEARLKDLSGETRIKARGMYKDFFEFSATHKLFLYSNHKPTVTGNDHGLWRRIKLVPFSETITDTERNPALPEQLRSEASGILNWVVKGCLNWQRLGLQQPQEVDSATREYRSEMDTLGAFLSDCCELGGGLSELSTPLYERYSAWMDASGEKPVSQKAFTAELRVRGPQLVGRCSKTGRKLWRGIALKAAA